MIIMAYSVSTIESARQRLRLRLGWPIGYREKKQHHKKARINRVPFMWRTRIIALATRLIDWYRMARTNYASRWWCLATSQCRNCNLRFAVDSVSSTRTWTDPVQFLRGPCQYIESLHLSSPLNWCSHSFK